MQPKEYSPPKADWIMRQLWKVSGADVALISKSTYTEQIKYLCIGGIIFSTSVFAFVSFYLVYNLIFTIKDASSAVALLNGFSSVIFGLIMSWFVFNFNRYIFISSSINDGTEAITFSEIIHAIPKIIVSLTLSIFVSIPLAVGLNNSYGDAGQKHGNPFQENLINFGKAMRDLLENNTTLALFVTVFIGIIFLSPILFQLIATKGPYDVMKENEELLKKMDLGIEAAYEYYQENPDKKISKIINHKVDLKLHTMKKIMEAQRRINEKTINEILKKYE